MPSDGADVDEPHGPLSGSDSGSACSVWAVADLDVAPVTPDLGVADVEMGDAADTDGDSESEDMQESHSRGVPGYITFSWAWADDAWTSEYKCWQYYGASELQWELRRIFRLLALGPEAQQMAPE